MRLRAVAVIFGVLAAGIAVPAFADTSYKMNFTTINGLAPTSGSFTILSDGTIQDFEIVWNTVTIDMTFAINNPDQGLQSFLNDLTSANCYSLVQFVTANCSDPAGHVDPTDRYDWTAKSFGGFFSFDLAVGSANTGDVGNGASAPAPPGAPVPPAINNGTYTASQVAPTVPEPTSLSTLLVGLVGLGYGFRRRWL